MQLMIDNDNKVYIFRDSHFRRVHILDWDIYCWLVSDANKWRLENGKDLHNLNQPQGGGVASGDAANDKSLDR